MTVTNEQLAQRQNLFRNANERIEHAADAVGHIGPRPFICECGLDGCVERVEVDAETYQEVRGHGARFVTLPGHEIDAIEIIVQRNELFQVVEKTDLFAEIAASGNPRE
jgi:hypothetical protein